MPIYEFFCAHCQTIFNFYSRRPETEKRPDCPKCGAPGLQKMLSTFATIGKAKSPEDDAGLAGADEARMQQVFSELMHEAGRINEDDPKQMAALMRKFADKTGLSLGGSMDEALGRMEAGEDPEQIEQEMGDRLEGEEPFDVLAMRKHVLSKLSRSTPTRDDRLYEL